MKKIETLALGLSDALKERRAHSANVGGALVRLTVKGRLSFAPEPPRTAANDSGYRRKRTRLDFCAQGARYVE